MKIWRVEAVWMDAYDVKVNLKSPQVTGLRHRDTDSVIKHTVCYV